MSIDPPPHILFVFTDQQSALALAGAGQPGLRTPNLDRLAARGVRFTRAYCASPVCGPSRACLATGRPPHDTGVRWNGQSLAAGLTTFGEHLRAVGYRTAWSGKWHVPKSYPTGPEEIPGFENLTLDANHPLLQRDIGYGWPGYGLGANTDGPFVDQAIRFLQQPHDRPFLLAVSLHNPHDICWWVRKPQRLPGPDELPRLPANFAIPEDEPEFLRRGRLRDHYGEEIRYTTGWSETDWQTYLHAYQRMTEQVDAEVGRLLDALEQQGLTERTMIVFTSDHGEGMAAHQWVAKLSFYDEVVRVPFIVAGPGVVGAGRVDSTSLISGLDIFPTLCDLGGAHVPPGPGRSLRPLLAGPDAWSRDYVVSEVWPDDKDPGLEGRMVVTRDFKYCAYSVGPGAESLHDLRHDPGEMHNLAEQPAYRAIRDEHRNLLQRWTRETGDSFAGPASAPSNPPAPGAPP